MSALPEVVPPGPSTNVATRTPDAHVLLTVINRLIDDKDLDFERVKEAVALYERLERRRMETEYNAAMSDAQAALLPVAKNQSNTHTKSRYADLAALAEAALPIINRAGFGITFSEFKSAEPNCYGIRAEVMHRSGFAKTYDFNVPIDGAGMKGSVNKTDTQAYGSTLTYGRRYATCMIFNIAIKDNDGNAQPNDNGPIDAEQVDALQALVAETNSNLEPFLATFSRVNKVDPPVTTLQGIPSRLFLSAKGLLIQKKNEMAKKAQQTGEAA